MSVIFLSRSLKEEQCSLTGSLDELAVVARIHWPTELHSDLVQDKLRSNFRAWPRLTDSSRNRLQYPSRTVAIGMWYPQTRRDRLSETVMLSESCTSFERRRSRSSGFLLRLGFVKIVYFILIVWCSSLSMGIILQIFVQKCSFQQ